MEKKNVTRMKKWKLDSYSESLLEDLFWKESEQ